MISKQHVKGEELYKTFQEQNWDDLYLKLESYAFTTLRYRYGIKGNNEEIKNLSKEMISDVLDLIFIKGTRNWCKQDCLDFNSFIFGVLKSHINNKYGSKKTKENKEKEINKTADPEIVEANIEESELKSLVYEELNKLNADDSELLVFECMADGLLKSKDISEDLGIDSKELHNIKRRLNKKISSIKEKLQNNGII